MRRVAVEIPVRVPADVLRQFVEDATQDRALSQAYFKLRGTSSPSRVVESTGDRVVIYEPAFDPSVRSHGMFRTGWTVTYAITAAGPAESCLKIDIAYNLMTAIAGMGLIRTQAQNEVIHRVTAVLAFEAGYHMVGGSAEVPGRAPLLPAHAPPQRLEGLASPVPEPAVREEPPYPTRAGTKTIAAQHTNANA